MLAASLEWPFALRMALRVSTREDLTARSDESRSRPLPCTRLVSAGLDLPRTGKSGLLGLGPSALGTMMLPVAVERSVSPALLVIERSSAELAGPSWMAGRRTRGPSPCPRAWTWHLSTPPWGPDRVVFLPEEMYFFRDTRRKLEDSYFFQFLPEETEDFGRIILFSIGCSEYVVWNHQL